ncbi:MAG: hypothetical protein M0C28_27555 [Candidatus Moduliflexus flocculans]|nr:hypothetical protein [Candidatus Moduliflexus flocculans]
MSENRNPLDEARQAALDLLAYCRANDWAGYDPYDALNSRVFRALPFLDFRLARLALTQGVKRSPVNLRPLLLVPRTPNPKGIALFLASTVKAGQGLCARGFGAHPAAGRNASVSPVPRTDAGLLGLQLRLAAEVRARPQGFAEHHLHDLRRQRPARRGRMGARSPPGRSPLASAADFILQNLFSRESGGRSRFRYTLVGNDEVHNANLLGAAYLCRIARVTGDRRYLEPALEAARFSVGRQHDDGSWRLWRSSDPTMDR